MKETQQFAEFLAVLTAETAAVRRDATDATDVYERVGLCPKLGYEVWQIARSIERLAVLACNRELTDRERSRDAKLAVRLSVIGSTLGVKFHIDGDPRGYVVKMATPKSERYNTFGGRETGWGIGSN